MTVRIAEQMEPLPGYRLIERIGVGGFGEVWKVEAPGGLLKAIKFVRGDLDEDDGDASAPAGIQGPAAHQGVAPSLHPVAGTRATSSMASSSSSWSWPTAT